MIAHRLSNENLHATSVALAGRAVLITGPSGSGKSDLALRLFDRGFALVSDDRTIVRTEAGRLIASAPPTILGKIEVRGIGIIEVEPAGDMPVALIVDLGGEIERMPGDSARRELLGIGVPIVAIDSASASAAAKVDLALARLGLRF
jgi:serine kinase of HPr protein (carbohydrate metabolism regulator)